MQAACHPPDDPTTPSIPFYAPTPPAPNVPLESLPIESKPDLVDNEASSVPLGHPTWDWKPSHHMCDLLLGKGVTSITKAGGVDPTLKSAKDAARIELIFAAKMLEAKALEPRTLAEAKRRPDWHLWEKAIQEELTTLKTAGTWRLEEAPPGANIIGSKWVFKAKKDAVGNIAHYKAQLVAQGFSQIGEVDYDDTYIPVAKLASSRAIIAMANQLGIELHQVDIKGVYLNEVLNNNKVLFMQHLPGYKSPDTETCVLCLVKTLYGLKQSGHHWYQKFTSIFTSLSLIQCSVDQAVFYKSNPCANELTVIAVHVDDCTIAFTSLHLVNALKDSLQSISRLLT
jgi:hypothetical protein